MSDKTSPDFGRVAADGTVYVITADGERSVGQIPNVTPEEALAFYVKRYQALEVEVNLLETRIQNRALSPDEARNNLKTLSENVANANAVGDLAALSARLEKLTPEIEAHAAARKEARAQQIEETKARKMAMVAEAEALANGSDWRTGVNRFRELLEEWKALPRVGRQTDQELWHRFSSARTTYTRRRKAQFAELSARREEAKAIKEGIIAEARELSSSTDWGKTTGDFRQLMRRWKAAGAAPREVEDKLWEEFRGLQDIFFTARTVANSAMESELQENLTAKELLLAKAEEKILPVSDLNEARMQLRKFLEEYNAIGRVPREAIRGLDNRVRAIDAAVKAAEEAEWKRTDPEARARAEDTVKMLEAQIAKVAENLKKAEARGDERAAKKAKDSIETYESWLESARATLAEFSA